MDTNEKKIALSVLESLRADLMYAHLKNGSRILDEAELRQYIYALTGSPLEVTRCKGAGLNGVYEIPENGTRSGNSGVRPHLRHSDCYSAGNGIPADAAVSKTCSLRPS